jgi:hypothetical protein
MGSFGLGSIEAAWKLDVAPDLAKGDLVSSYHPLP